MTNFDRRQKVVGLISKLGLDALVFCQPENLRYLCGFSGSDGVLIVTAERLVFQTDSRYTIQARAEVSADSILEYKTKPDGVIEALSDFGVRKIGFEADLSFDFVTSLKSLGDPEWQWLAVKDEFQALRLHKSAEEIAAIARAAELNVVAFAEIEQLIRPGVRERDIALALEFALRKNGAEERAFDIIVASGTRGAMPHGVASDKILAQGELVTIDFGCRLSGYHSDETITVALGEVSDDLRLIHDTVLQAHDMAMTAVAPGVPLFELDRIARGHIESCGFGEYFGHGLGHGVGLQIHEAPTVSPRSKAVAEEGMVFTVEPGIYVPNIGGVRIEDMILVTSDGYRVLTKIPKSFKNVLLN